MREREKIIRFQSKLVMISLAILCDANDTSFCFVPVSVCLLSFSFERFGSRKTAPYFSYFMFLLFDKVYYFTGITIVCKIVSISSIYKYL